MWVIKRLIIGLCTGACDAQGGIGKGIDYISQRNLYIVSLINHVRVWSHDCLSLRWGEGAGQSCTQFF